ncbi:MAG TPA: NAD(P)-dependent oxidoreductase [Arcobacter sp.]|nr:NAD(P)-dependent oxidoreductase [Arcobacter sp.]
MKKRIGIIGTGFIGKGLYNLILSKDEFEVVKVLTRSNINKREGYVSNTLTNSILELITNSDIIIECTGEVLYTTENILEIAKTNIPIITMNTEFHITTGSYFVDKCYLTEAEGDQPGCLAALNEEAVSMGFKPKVYGNIKGFLNKNPTENDMKIWAKKSNLSLDMVTSFTDGTKVQMEMAFVANGLDASIIKQACTGHESSDINVNANLLAMEAEKIKMKISDYIISPKGPSGVFITATHDKKQKSSLSYYKAGSGPYYTLVKPYHFPHIELYKTIVRVSNGGQVLLNNSSNPKISVCSIAKCDLEVGTYIDKAIGSFIVRGEAVKIEDCPRHIPIGLLNKARIKKAIKKDSVITFDDIEIDDNIALQIWFKIMKEL